LSLHKKHMFKMFKIKGFQSKNLVSEEFFLNRIMKYLFYLLLINKNGISYYVTTLLKPK
jgi:hypothetical protein